MITGWYGYEVTWTIEGEGRQCSGGSYADHQEYTEQCCLPEGTYNLTCTDSYRDGWNGGRIIIDGVEYCGGFQDGHMQQEVVTIAPLAGFMTPPCAPVLPLPRHTHQ